MTDQETYRELRAAYIRMKKRTYKMPTSMKEFGSGNIAYDVVVRASIVRCIEINIASLRSKYLSKDSFLLPGFLRGVCEDLIVLSFLKKYTSEVRNEYVIAKNFCALNNSIDAQRKFFSANNPYQPLIGAGIADPEMANRLRKSDARLKEVCRKMGLPGAKEPTIKSMSAQVGLPSTYSYIYHLTSNYVHFNPPALFRMGWGSEEGPIRLSSGNMRRYYLNLSMFYASMLFLGFAYRLSNYIDVADPAVKTDLILVEAMISNTHRWPEIITIEEMNQKQPLWFLVNSFASVMREDDPSRFGQILREIKGLP